MGSEEGWLKSVLENVTTSVSGQTVRLIGNAKYLGDFLRAIAHVSPIHVLLPPDIVGQLLSAASELATIRTVEQLRVWQCDPDLLIKLETQTPIVFGVVQLDSSSGIEYLAGIAKLLHNTCTIASALYAREETVDCPLAELDAVSTSMYLTGQYFPSFPIVRGVPSCKLESIGGDSCVKHKTKGRNLAHGILVFMCADCESALGFSIMDKAEGPR